MVKTNERINKNMAIKWGGVVKKKNLKVYENEKIT